MAGGTYRVPDHDPIIARVSPRQSRPVRICGAINAYEESRLHFELGLLLRLIEALYQFSSRRSELEFPDPASAR
jgi:hypothetical protein